MRLPQNLLGRISPQTALSRSGALNRDAARRFLAELGNRPTFAYLPWIALHGDALIQGLPQTAELAIAALPIFHGTNESETRHLITRLAKQRPGDYRQLLAEALQPLAGKIAGFLFTFDWHPVMRALADVCRELGILRVLIPHESVFAERERYYRYVPGNIGRPSCDRALCWGELQRDLFVERGYPSERTVLVGSPKLDRYHDYRPSVTREDFCQRLGFDPEKRTLLFVAQALDMAGSRGKLRRAQAQAIADALAFARAEGHNFLLRSPPSADRVLPVFSHELKGPGVAHDRAPDYAVSPEDTLYHSDLVISLNSTMLFEAALLGVPSLGARYLELESSWSSTGMPLVASRDELVHAARGLLASRRTSFSEAGWRWARQSFSAGSFDGQAARRIAAELVSYAKSPPTAYDPVKELMRGAPLENVAIAHADELPSSQRYLRELLGAKSLIAISERPRLKLAQLTDPAQRGEASVALFGDGPTRRAFHSDVCVQQGMVETPRGRRLREAATRVGRPLVHVEDGFLLSTGSDVGSSPALSLLLDPEGPHYDARRPSALENALASSRELTSEEHARARAAVSRIVSLRVSQYNHARIEPLPIDARYRRRVLVVDQRKDDAAITCGLASHASFQHMLERALADNPEAEVIVKRHPDAIADEKLSSFAELARKLPPNVRLLDGELNPYCVLDVVDAVYVVTAGMGFEALMAGKPVHCFGMPFYAGWGATQDELRCERRTRRRSLEELFHFAYIEFARYFDPESGQRCSVERVTEYLARARDESGGAPR